MQLTSVWAYFHTAQTGTASTVTNAFERLKNIPAWMRVPQPIPS
jgi:hypothetical protein